MQTRNILIITVGATPQIVTETVHALLTQPKPFVPDEIHLVTTSRAAAVFEPFTKPGSMLEELYAYLRLAERYTALHLVPVLDKSGAYVADVRTEREAIAFGNTVTKLIASFAEDPRNRIHVSLAGGRKTMGWYAGAALSIFGRDHDELSHVLVEHTKGDPEALEGCDDFWWPTFEDCWLPHRFKKDEKGEPRLFNARNGRIDLARIPFVRLKHILSESAFPKGEIDYEAVVAAVEESLSGHRLRLVVDDRAVRAGRYRFRLEHRHFAFYWLLAKIRKEKWPPARGTGLPGEYFGWLSLHDLGNTDGPYLKLYYELLIASRRTDNDKYDPDKMLADAQKELSKDMLAFLKRFSQSKSSISGPSGILRKEVANPVLRDRIEIKTEENAEGFTCFGLLLEPNQIEILESE